MAPSSVRVCVSRTVEATCRSSFLSEPQGSPAALRALATAAVLDRAVSAFAADEDVDVLALGSSSSGYALGYDEESAVVDRLEQRWGLSVCATSLSTVSALRSHRIRRVSLIHPPWFGVPLHRLGAEYFADQGFEVIDAQLADLPEDPDRIQPSSIVDWVAQHLSPDTEAVVLGGNGFRAAQAVHALGARTGRLVLAANQVLLWAALTRASMSPPSIRGFGKLFDSLKGAGG